MAFTRTPSKWPAKRGPGPTRPLLMPKLARLPNGGPRKRHGADVVKRPVVPHSAVGAAAAATLEVQVRSQAAEVDPHHPAAVWGRSSFGVGKRHGPVRVVIKKPGGKSPGLSSLRLIEEISLRGQSDRGSITLVHALMKSPTKRFSESALP